MATENDILLKLREHILSSLLQDPLLSDLNTDLTLQGLRYRIRAEEVGLMKLKVKKFDGNIFKIEVLKNSRVRELKNEIKREVSESIKGNESGPQISWKHVWNRFALAYKQTVLLDDNRELQSYDVGEGCEVKFIVKLREKEKKKPRNKQ